MAVEKGWCIKLREPNDVFYTLSKDVNGMWTKDISVAILFSRERDANDFFESHFQPETRPNYEIVGIN